jgi:hypothetical protein
LPAKQKPVTAARVDGTGSSARRQLNGGEGGSRDYRPTGESLSCHSMQTVMTHPKAKLHGGWEWY